jgi:adenosylcobinamide-phosphate synthase
MTTLLVAAVALALDWLLGEPRRLHPLVGFGRLASLCERWVYGGKKVSPQARRVRGLCATVLLLAPVTTLVAALAAQPPLGLILSIAVLCFALGITIGGPARYAGEWRVRPVLGAGQLPVADHIERALKLVRHGVGLWLGTFMFAGPVHA